MKLPEYYQRAKSMPGDPEGSSAYGTGSNNFEAFVLVFPIPLSEVMPIGNDEAIIKGIHNSVAENQALIEVKSGQTKGGKIYAYSIVKTKMEPSGMQYFLLLDMADPKTRTAEQFRGFFSETGMTGVRDTTVYSQLVNEGYLKPGDTSAWMRDQYDETLTGRFLMNLSEVEGFDEYFPEHPLSVARKTVGELVENN